MTTTTTSTSTPCWRWRAASAPRSSCRSASARTCGRGASPSDRIVELDWNQSARIGDLTLVCTPARHFSGRFLTRNTTLWASWAIIGPQHRAYFGGDTGYTKQLRRDRRRARAVRPDADADRRLQHGLARHSHESRGGRPRAPRRHRRGGLLVPIHWAHVPARAASVGRARRAAAGRRRAARCRRGGAQAR